MGWRHDRGRARLGGYAAITSRQQYVADRFRLACGADRRADGGGAYHRLDLLAHTDWTEAEPAARGRRRCMSGRRWVGLSNFPLSHYRNFKLSHYPDCPFNRPGIAGTRNNCGRWRGEEVSLQYLSFRLTKPPTTAITPPICGGLATEL